MFVLVCAVQWLSQNAVRVTSLNISSTDDYSDLEQFARSSSIGQARIVLLGENSHGDGATTLAKNRLIAFLHARLGFDVVAFERCLLALFSFPLSFQAFGWPMLVELSVVRCVRCSGLYGVHRGWQLIQQGSSRQETFDAMDKTLFTLWTQTLEFQPLVDYVDKHKNAARPLEIAGFDIQMSGELCVCTCMCVSPCASVRVFV